MDIASLQKFLEEHKQPAYRLKQALQAFFVLRGESWDAVTAWPKALRDEAKKEVPWDTLEELAVTESVAGDTVKFLLACADGAKIETALMRHGDGRNTVCVSSQVGCPMKCAFCATGALGFTRNLTASEIAEQVIHAARWLKRHDANVTNIVYMGMGEPMHNYDEVMRSVRMLNDSEGFNLGARHMSISTCGIVPGILKLASEPLQVNLAISLHAAIPETRSKLMPVNRAYPLDKLMKAVDAYAEKTNRKVMFEYLLIKGVNDGAKDADAVARLIGHRPNLYHMNVIAYHDTGVFIASDRDTRTKFVERLRERGIPATHRRSFGEDINAACGQLAAKANPKS